MIISDVSDATISSATLESSITLLKASFSNLKGIHSTVQRGYESKITFVVRL